MHEVKLFLRILIYPCLLAIFFSCSSYQVPADNSEEDLSFSGSLFFKNNRNGNMWTIKRSEKFHSSDSAKQYLMKLNEGAYNDWRFPTKQELYDLFMIFDLKNNGDVKISIEGAYWLVSGDGRLSIGAWEIGDGCGPERTFISWGKGAIMAVRY